MKEQNVRSPSRPPEYKRPRTSRVDAGRTSALFYLVDRHAQADVFTVLVHMNCRILLENERITLVGNSTARSSTSLARRVLIPEPEQYSMAFHCSYIGLWVHHTSAEGFLFFCMALSLHTKFVLLISLVSLSPG